MLEGSGMQDGGGIKGKYCENCNLIINKIYLKDVNISSQLEIRVIKKNIKQVMRTDQVMAGAIF